MDLIIYLNQEQDSILSLLVSQRSCGSKTATAATAATPQFDSLLVMYRL